MRYYLTIQRLLLGRFEVVIVVKCNELIIERLEGLRKKIYKVEKKLVKYGFDLRRGVESYRINELRKLLERSGDKEKAKALLMQLVNLQEQLYLELYRLVGLKHLNVDTDTPEKRLTMIKEWLLTGKTSPAQPRKSRFKQALKAVTKSLEECDENCVAKIEEALRSVYKRDYDRYRVAKWILELCVSYGWIDEDILKDLESLPIRILAERVAECVHRVGKEKLLKIIRVKGGIR